jgi:hypothetical protein
LHRHGQPTAKPASIDTRGDVKIRLHKSPVSTPSDAQIHLQLMSEFTCLTSRRHSAWGSGSWCRLARAWTRLAYQLAVPAGVPAFEVDMPENIAYKRDRLRVIFGRVPDGVLLVAMRFETDDLADSLAAQGFRADVCPCR